MNATVKLHVIMVFKYNRVKKKKWIENDVGSIGKWVLLLMFCKADVYLGIFAYRPRPD